jgi:uncharacterized membrane protein
MRLASALILCLSLAACVAPGPPINPEVLKAQSAEIDRYHGEWNRGGYGTFVHMGGDDYPGPAVMGPLGGGGGEKSN